MLQAVPYPSLITISLPLYPSFLVPDNLPAPYGVIDIPPSSTVSLQSIPWRDYRSTHWQLVSERVKLIFYGLRNDDVMDFFDYAVDYSTITGNFGLTNMPVVRDEKRTQTELAALAQKKSIEFEITYNQYRARNVARQVIQSAIPAFYPQDIPVLPVVRPIVPPLN
jgi:hypothetical protein